MTQPAGSPEVPEEARERAAALSWPEDLIDRAVAQGFSLELITQALRAGTTAEQAEGFLGRSQGLTPDLGWMRVPTEWGVRGAPSDPAMGLQIGDVMLGAYGEVPDLWTNRTEIARGSHPAEGQEDMGYTIFEKAIVWADSAPRLYEAAIRDRWAPATDLNWRSLEPLPDDAERAVCQLMTELSERAYAQGAVLGRWLPEISYGFIESKLYLSTAIFDLARHAEAFRKRALANGGGLGLAAPSDLIRGAVEARTFPELVAYLFVQDSMLLTLLRHGDDLAQNQLERDLYKLAAIDRERILQYQVDRMAFFLEKLPDRREEQNRYLRKAEVRMAREWRDPAVNEPLAILLGGGRDAIAQGLVALRELRCAQIAAYEADLARAGFERTRLHSGLREYLEDPGEA